MVEMRLVGIAGVVIILIGSCTIWGLEKEIRFRKECEDKGGVAIMHGNWVCISKDALIKKGN